MRGITSILSCLLLSFSSVAFGAQPSDARVQVGHLGAAVLNALGAIAVSEDGVVRIPTLPDVDPLVDPGGLSRGDLPPPPASPSLRNDCDAEQARQSVATYIAQARAWAAWAVDEIDQCAEHLDLLAGQVETSSQPAPCPPSCRHSSLEIPWVTAGVVATPIVVPLLRFHGSCTDCVRSVEQIRLTLQDLWNTAGRCAGFTKLMENLALQVAALSCKPKAAVGEAVKIALEAAKLNEEAAARRVEINAQEIDDSCSAQALAASCTDSCNLVAFSFPPAGAVVELPARAVAGRLGGALYRAAASTSNAEDAAVFRAMASYLVRAPSSAIRHVGFASEEPQGFSFVAMRPPFAIGGPDVFIVSALPADADVPSPNLADLERLDQALNEFRQMFLWLPPGDSD